MNDIEHAHHVEAAVEQLADHIATASGAALEAHLTLHQLHALNDVDLFDGSEGPDAMHELTEAMRHLRNARRIAEHRAAMQAEDAQERIAAIVADADAGHITPSDAVNAIAEVVGGKRDGEVSEP